jgi:hypothetical protein
LGAAGLEVCWSDTVATPWLVGVGLVLAGAGEGAVAVLPMSSGDAGTVLWLVVVGPGGSPCAVSVWGEMSEVAGDGDGSWAGLDDCCSGAAATLSLVEAGLAGASACTAPDWSVPWDVAGFSLVEAGLAGVSACTDPELSEPWDAAELSLGEAGLAAVSACTDPDPEPCDVEAS